LKIRLTEGRIVGADEHLIVELLANLEWQVLTQRGWCCRSRSRRDNDRGCRRWSGLGWLDDFGTREFGSQVARTYTRAQQHRHVSFIVAEINLHACDWRISDLNLRNDCRERTNICSDRLFSNYLQLGLVFGRLTTHRKVVDLTNNERECTPAIESGDEVKRSGKPSLLRRYGLIPGRLSEIVNKIRGSNRVARSFFRAKRQTCLGIDVSGVVGIDGVKSDVDDASCFYVSSDLIGVTTKMRAPRDDFNFHVCGAGKVCKRHVVGQSLADAIGRLRESERRSSVLFLSE
jgi:hypothetical protein